MIKNLIEDIAFDRITLAQALTRTKLISAQIRNETLKQWLKKELEGYDHDDKFLPSYRKIWSEIELEVVYIHRPSEFIPIHLKPGVWGKDFIDQVYNVLVTESVAVVEQNIADMDNSIAYLQVPVNQVEILSQIYKDQLSENGAAVRRGRRKVGKNQLRNVIEQTKQKLLDVLQDLEAEFPELGEKYSSTTKSDAAVQNIINTTIYGGNNPMNIAAGKDIVQGNITMSTAEKEQLRSFGVEEKEIVELEGLNKDHPVGSSKRKEKLMNWLSKVSASLAARGIYDGTPHLVEFIGNMI